MNREIKFRGKCLNEGYWLYGSFVDNTKCDFDSYINDDSYNLKVVDRDTVGQFTGLHDKNGVPIYEGDFVKNENMLGEIKYVTEHAAFMILEEMGYLFIEAGNAPQTNYEIIGNIHENEDLLKQKDGN